jgi:hypothetical protein
MLGECQWTRIRCFCKKQRAQKPNTLCLGLLGMNRPIAYSYVLRLRRRDSSAKIDSYRMVFTRSLWPIPEMAEKGRPEFSDHTRCIWVFF